MQVTALTSLPGVPTSSKEIDLMPNPDGLSYFVSLFVFFAGMAPSNKNVDVNSDVKSVCMLRGELGCYKGGLIQMLIVVGANSASNSGDSSRC